MTIWDGGSHPRALPRRAGVSAHLSPPYRVDGRDYIEGAAIDTINFRALVAEAVPQ